MKQDIIALAIEFYRTIVNNPHYYILISNLITIFLLFALDDNVGSKRKNSNDQNNNDTTGEME